LGTPEGEVEDVCQEVFLVTFRRLSSFADGCFTTWLYRIIANIVSSRHRKRRVRQMFQLALRPLMGRNGDPGGQEMHPFGLAIASTRSPESEASARETKEGVRQILERMPPKKREVFVLHEIEGLSGEQVAERVGCKIETVWTRLHYARRDFERMARKRGLLP
jgi:RNA polymerase sigma-70 factor (ECF subfamily)